MWDCVPPLKLTLAIMAFLLLSRSHPTPPPPKSLWKDLVALRPQHITHMVGGGELVWLLYERASDDVSSTPCYLCGEPVLWPTSPLSACVSSELWDGICRRLPLIWPILVKKLRQLHELQLSESF